MNKWEESETRRCQPIIRADDQALYKNTNTMRGQINFSPQNYRIFQYYHDNDWVGLQPHVAAVLKSLI